MLDVQVGASFEVAGRHAIVVLITHALMRILLPPGDARHVLPQGGRVVDLPTPVGKALLRPIELLLHR